jgi:LysR family transcriptional regulator, regulator for metE and metH
MDVDTRSLELLEAIAADGTLTAAARRLHVSQPALSQRLANLEAHVGLRLFDRQGRRLVPTDAGRRLLHTTTTVLAELRAAARDLADIRSGRSGVLRLASQCSTNYQWLPAIVHDFGLRWPGIDVRIESVEADEPIAALLADRLDVALTAKPDRRTQALDLHPLFEDTMVAVVPPDHPWADRPFVDAADFEGVTLHVFDSYDPARTPTLPLPIPPEARPARIVPTPVVTELAIEMVLASQGVAVLPAWPLRPYVAAGRVATVAITERPDRWTWSCATRRSPAAPVADFVAVLREHIAAA